MAGRLTTSSGLAQSIALFAICAPIVLGAVPGLLPGVIAADLTSTNAAAAQVLTAEGTVDLLRSGKADWTAAAAGQMMGVGDQLRTGVKSRAAVRLTNLSVLRISELSTYEIEPPRTAGRKIIDLKSGAAYFFSREKPPEFELRSPIATGAIRGTEFAILVSADGQTTMTVIDGEVELSNAQGSVVLTNSDQAVVRPGMAPVKTAVINARNIVQWNLYYPAVVDPAELEWTPELETLLGPSLQAYRSGDLLAALRNYPDERKPASDTERVYLAALLLTVGLVEKSEGQLNAATISAGRAARLAEALRELIAAVRLDPWKGSPAPQLASEWLAESYLRQSRGQLKEALAASRKAVDQSSSFAFGWERVAELEFSFGHTADALAALKRSLELAPRNAQALALKGFLLSAENRISEAIELFEQAISIDGALGNAWLGRGLCRIRRGEDRAGLQDLETAAALEPNRSLLRSYLGKAFDQVADETRAEHELQLAKQFDPKDPTSWLYSALLHQQQNRINEAIRDLEESEELNQNRRLYRSGLLLDQDEAVRGANLANVYRDAGMEDVSVREASRAVNADYANYSAHLFLADSYNQLRDPNQVNLRYETPWLSEFLLANLLGPVGAGTLSQTVSQQDYSKLFQQDSFGVASSTEYLSRGDWLLGGAQYGTLGNFGYAVDSLYRSDTGWRPNEDQQQLTLSASFKAQLSPSDTILLQSIYYNASGGDLAEYYNVDEAHTGLRFKETQEPLLLAGYHHQWGPGMHTLLLVGRFQDSFSLTDPEQQVLLLGKDAGGQVNAVASPSLPVAALNYHSDLEIYSTEVQQLWQQDNNEVVLGARYQTGRFETLSDLGASTPTLVASMTSTSAVAFATPAFHQQFTPNMERISGYAYDQWRPWEPLQLSAGIAYDHLEAPLNYRSPPIAAGQTSQGRASPKAGFTWTPLAGTAVRFAYTRSLGGVSFDQSARLEPTQVAGFTQAFRSLIPESVAGSLTGARFETFGLAWDQKFATGTYLGVDAQLLKSDVSSTLGEVDLNFPPTYVPSGIREDLRYEERDLQITLNQLVGDCFSVGAQYRLSRAELDSNLPQIPDSVSPSARVAQDATLHQLTFFGLFYHPSGFFARAEAVWYAQNNQGYQPALPGDDFWQVNLSAGYRFFRRRAQVQVGLLNATGQDYRLNPLDLYQELPRARTLMASLQLIF